VTMAHSAQNACVVPLNPHASTATETLLSPPEFAVNVSLGDWDASGQPGDIGDERLAMRLACSRELEHKRIVTEAAPIAVAATK
jgi:hypothetical protein